MSTRGLYGLRKNGIDKYTYNHFDSYPSGLGRNVLEFCAENDVNKLSKLFNNIELVYKNETPTKDQIDICKREEWADFSVSSGRDDEWYCLLRHLQGNFKEYSKAIENDKKVFMTNDAHFIKDSLFCEYAYIINLDDEVLEFFVGFQQKPQNNNRYGTNKKGKYYPCRLLYAIPLNKINFENTDELVIEMENISALALAMEV